MRVQLLNAYEISRKVQNLKDVIQYYGLEALPSLLGYSLLDGIPQLRRFVRMLYVPGGLKVLIPPREDYFRSALANYGEIYVQRLYEKFEEYSVSRGEKVLDVGAFIGLYTLRAAVMCGSEGVVYSIEPCSPSYRYLETNVSLNRLHNVVALNIAFGRDSGSILMSYRDLPVYFSMLSEPDAGYRQRVRVLSIDDFVSRYSVEHIDVAKVDAEGAEMDIVRGAQSTLNGGMISRMVVEMHKKIYGKCLASRMLIEVLSDYGYVVGHVVDVDAYCSVLYVKHHR